MKLWIILGATLGLALADISAARANTTALVGGMVIDVSDFGNSDSDIRNAVVLIDGEIITSVGTLEEVEIPANARIVNVEGKYIIPGLIDGYGAIDNQAFANAYLYMGVTSVVTAHGYKRAPLYEEADPSPNIYLCGDVGHHPTTTQDMLKRIEDLGKDGVKFLLLMYALTEDQVPIAVEKAHELGMVTIGETVKLSYGDVIESGVDAFLHFIRYSVDLAPAELRARLSEQTFGPAEQEYRKWLVELDPDAPVVAEHAAVLGSSPVALIPTLAVSCIDSPHLDNPWNEPVSAILDPEDIHNPLDKSTGKHYGPQVMEYIARATQNFIDIERKYYQAGAKYLAGSGADINGTMPGVSLHQELQLLTLVGLTERQALAAATANFAAFFDWTEVGQIEPGCRADIVVVNGNPLEDILSLKEIAMVVLRGKVLDKGALLEI